MNTLGAVGRFLLPIALVALLGCDEPANRPEQRGGASAAYAGAWRLVDGYGPAGEIRLIAGYRITMVLSETSLVGRAACNTYAGDVTIEGHSFRANGMSVTEMGCRRDVTESQDAYLDALGEVDSINRTGKTLTLEGDRTELRFRLLLPVPTADLVGTRWKLKTLIHGSGNAATVSSAHPAHLVIKGDGTLTGSTGCRVLDGKWREQGDEVYFYAFSADGRCPQRLREQDAHVVNSLGDGFTIEIQGDRLTVIGRFESGLEYRATN